MAARVNLCALQEWPETNYPPYANGPGYIITRDIADFISRMKALNMLRVRELAPSLSPSPSPSGRLKAYTPLELASAGRAMADAAACRRRWMPGGSSVVRVLIWTPSDTRQLLHCDVGR